jgi:hypothetical protein
MLEAVEELKSLKEEKLRCETIIRKSQYTIKTIRFDFYDVDGILFERGANSILDKFQKEISKIAQKRLNEINVRIKELEK